MPGSPGFLPAPGLRHEMGITFTAYLGLTWILRLIAPLVSLICAAPPGSGAAKLARGIKERSEAHRRLAAWGRGRARGDRELPLVWMHAPSAGEAQQARAVIARLRELRPETQVVFTYFSPSARDFASEVGADFSDCLPWDLPWVLRPAVRALAPDLAVFTKTEVWPTLARELARAGTPTALVAGTVSAGSRRLGFLARRLLGPAWGGLSLCCAVDEVSARRLRALGVTAEVRVTGDPGTEAAVGRVRSGAGTRLTALPDRPVLVAGSTWPADEKVLLPAIREVRRSVPELLLVLAPHEPSESRLHGITRRLGDRRTWTTFAEIEFGRSSFDRLEAPPDQIGTVLVERVGALAALYGLAADADGPGLAFVGGGFGRRGLHSVIEPAAAGCPVIFGPRHERAPAARKLIELGAGFTVADPGELVAAVLRLLASESRRAGARKAGLGFAHEELGAAKRTAELLSGLLDSGSKAQYHTHCSHT